MGNKYIEMSKLEKLVSEVFVKCGVSREDSEISAKILVASDSRGIRSHGIARINLYVNGLKNGGMVKDAIPTIIHETNSSFVLNANGAMGLSTAKKSMDKIIKMAKNTGFAFCSIANSNHFGIAAYYSEMAAREDMIGIAMTNTAALGVPTFAREAMFGTNPIAFAAPALNGKMFSLDMATTVVPRGKIEVYKREGKKLPKGWAVGTNGLHTDDPVSLLDDMLYRRGGGLLPLGGEGEMFSGYKGYGLATLVDIMCGIASGGVYGKQIIDIPNSIARVCHFLMCIKIDMFRNTNDFKKDLNTMLEELNSLTPAEGASKVYYAGEKEHENYKKSLKDGVPLSEDIWNNLLNTAKNEGVDVSFYV